MKYYLPLMPASLLLEARNETSNIERRCVYDVAGKNEYGDSSAKERLSRAFAICRSSLQKSGRMKKGTAELTKAGAKRSSAKGRKSDNKKKTSGFEKLVKAARK